LWSVDMVGRVLFIRVALSRWPAGARRSKALMVWFFFVSLQHGNASCLDIGAAALEGGSFLVYGRTSGSGADRCHGREGGVVFGEHRVVAGVHGSSCRCHVPCFGGQAEGKPSPNPWAAASSVDVVSFLKASLRFSLSSFVLRVKTQDPRIGRWRHFGVVIFLKTLSWSSRHAALRWWCGGGALSLDGVRSSVVVLRQGLRRTLLLR
jgi:hypothetical protein